MDPFGRWSPQQRLLEEIATQESRGYGPRKRYRLPLGLAVGLAVGIIVVFLVAALVTAPPPPGDVDPLCADIHLAAVDGRAVTPTELERTRSIIESRLLATGVVGPTIDSHAPDRIAITLPGVAPESEEARRLLGLVGAVGALEFRPVPFELASESLTDQPLPEAMRDMMPIIDGSGLVAVSLSQDRESAEPVVELQLDEVAAAAFDAHARDHFGERFAIVIDGVVRMAPSIYATRYDGQLQISGDLTPENADSLVALLRFGALPVEISEGQARACGGAAAS